MSSDSLRRYALLAALIGLHVLAGFLAGFFFPAGPWVEQLVKPAFYPPAVAFPIVWTMLYALMGASLWLFILSERPNKGPALALYGVQMAVNLSFTPLMFGLQSTLLGFLNVLALVPLVALTIIRFHRFSRGAALILVPYLGWISFALVLAGSLWWLNG